jgi:rSAM/selenodomain-associated transferase 1
VSLPGPAGTVVVFAKVPEPGRVKTRMCPPLSPIQAAGLYSAMLDDVLHATAEFARQLGLEALLALHPGTACEQWAERVPPGYRIIAQRGDSLAERMANAVDEVAAEADRGQRPILLRGSDSPALPMDRLTQALRALKDHDIALSPDRDGGYSLVGLVRPWPGLFALPLSTRHVLQDTLALARELGARATLVGDSFDLDRIEDLLELRRVAQGPQADLCRRTLEFVGRANMWPAPAS